MVCAVDDFFERFPPLMNRRNNPEHNNAFNRALNHARNHVLNGGRRAQAVEQPYRAVQEMPVVLNARPGIQEFRRAQDLARNNMHNMRNQLDEGMNRPPIPPGLRRIDRAPYGVYIPPPIAPRNGVFNDAFVMPQRGLLNQAYYRAHNRMHDEALNRQRQERDGVEGFKPMINQPFRPVPNGLRYQAPEQDRIGQRLAPPERPDMDKEDIQRLVRRFKDSYELRRRQPIIHPREEHLAPKNNHWNFPQARHDDDVDDDKPA